jgi:phosphate transport system permease protein
VAAREKESLRIAPRSARVLLPPARRFADPAFRALVLLCAISLLAVVALIILELVWHSKVSIRSFGLRFFVNSAWDPVGGNFGALPFIYGTLVSSLLALIIAVPLSVGVALFTTEVCPRSLRGILSFMVELLAAIPSVIYGLWGIFVLAPLLRNFVEPWLARTLGWTGLFDGAPYGIGMLAAGVILAIMIIPIIASITREVVMAVPHQQREAVLALGATKWEVMRTGVLSNARAGIAPGSTLASVIANEFTEATGDLYLSALFEIGLALFIITLIVNVFARLLVWSVTRGVPERAVA